MLNVCSSREQSKNSSAIVMGEGRGARGSFDLMLRLGVKRQGQTIAEGWGRSTGSHRSDGTRGRN
ncbi:hypothetical protein IEO21_10662 [Rhodonia placenta]|uniref:Uncharacterized protein n=1 Tax=Rhodonia placenta TaxID=104341 RepID=A0A8H7NS25_9APHY|nr:hypothetical protein IEO21_10662 [Postia placenta]